MDTCNQDIICNLTSPTTSFTLTTTSIPTTIITTITMKEGITETNNDKPSPTSTEQSEQKQEIFELSFCRNPDFKHCFNKCPCPRWLNCNYYIDKEEQQKRLKRKHAHNGTIKEIQEWYSVQFRINWNAPSIYMSG